MKITQNSKLKCQNQNLKLKISNLFFFDKYLIFLFLVFTVFVFYFSYFSIKRVYTLNSYYYDLGIMDQVVYNTSRGRFLEMTNPTFLKNMSRLAIHFDPILAFFAPFYYFWPKFEILLIDQVLFVGLGGMAIFLLSNLLLKDKKVSFIHTAISIAIILLIVSLTYLNIIPQKHFISPEISSMLIIPAKFAMYYLAGIISIYIISWYLVSTITESLKMRERQLQEKIQEMIDLAREKTRYMLVTTHELKAPFAAIQSYINVALDGYAGELTDKVKEILWKIHARCNMLAQMITDMIQLANITSLKERPQEVLMTRVDVVPLIINLLPRFKEIAAKKKISFETGDLKYQHHYIRANVEQLQILLNNLINNSLSYCYPNTSIYIDAEERNSSLVIEIRDSGIGIKKEHLEKVFLEHFRSEKAVEMNPNSTGLGLTIARQIMDIHHGRIWIESEEGIGTSVFLEFPKISM